MSFDLQHCADSFAELRSLEADCVDVVLTDPPYNEHVQKNQISGTAMKNHVTGGSGGIPHIELPFVPLAGYDWVPDIVRGARRWTISFCAVEDFGEFKRAAPEAYVRGGIWYKPNAQGQMTGDRPAACYEGLAILHKAKKKVWNGHGSYGLWPCNSTRGEKERHPNQKPLLLCLKLVALFTNRGETVLDPFCGSGRIGEACVLLGRHYIGLNEPLDDKGVDWIAKANERLRAAEKAPPWTDEAALKLCTARKADILEVAA